MCVGRKQDDRARRTEYERVSATSRPAPVSAIYNKPLLLSRTSRPVTVFETIIMNKVLAKFIPLRPANFPPIMHRPSNRFTDERATLELYHV